MRRLAGLLLAGVVLAACGLFAPQRPQMSVRDWVIGSWQGVDLIVLERHPWFSYRQPEVRALSDGTETWVYSSCHSRSAGGAVAFGRVTTANSTSWDECCYSQFFIRLAASGAKRVVEYRPTRTCAIDCTVAAGGCQR